MVAKWMLKFNKRVEANFCAEFEMINFEEIRKHEIPSNKQPAIHKKP